MPGELEKILSEIAPRYRKIRSGLAIGFGDGAIVKTLAEFRGGVWMDADASGELPFEDEQFEVVVIASNALSRTMVREANRVLVSGGMMFFTVKEKTRSQEGFTPPEVYRMIREGFDIVSVNRPKWWYFGLKGRTLSVAGRKKAWREHKRPLANGAFLWTPMED